MKTSSPTRPERRALASAISAIVASTSAVPIAVAQEEDEEGLRELEEVIVSARKRDENRSAT